MADRFGRSSNVLSGTDDKLLLDKSMLSTLCNPVNASGARDVRLLLSSINFSRFFISWNVSDGILRKLLLDKSKVRRLDRICKFSGLTSAMMLS